MQLGTIEVNDLLTKKVSHDNIEDLAPRFESTFDAILNLVRIKNNSMKKLPTFISTTHPAISGSLSSKCPTEVILN